MLSDFTIQKCKISAEGPYKGFPAKVVNVDFRSQNDVIYKILTNVSGVDVALWAYPHEIKLEVTN